jgi:L-malate glycosyltransferase
MKLAFVSTMAGVPWGGSEALWHQTAKLALEKKHQVLTCTFNWNPVPEKIQELTRLGAKNYFRPLYTSALSVRIYRRIKASFSTTSEEIKTIKGYKPDVLLLNQSGGYDILHRPDLQQFFLETSIPYFVICHNYNEEFVLTDRDRDVLRQIYGKAQNVFMICQPQAEVIMKQLIYKFPNIKIVANPINLKEVEPVPFPASGPIQFASVASLNVDRKGQDILLEVLSHENWKNRSWQLNFYGTGPHKKYLKELVGYFGLEGKVAFQGHVHDINSLWKENHILLLSSRIETGPMVLTEAMLCGRPVVSTQVGKVQEMVQHGVNGFVAPAATVSLFGNAMEQAWQQKEQWPALGLNAYQSAISRIDLEAEKTFLSLLLGA